MVLAVLVLCASQEKLYEISWVVFWLFNGFFLGSIPVPADSAMQRGLGFNILYYAIDHVLAFVGGCVIWEIVSVMWGKRIRLSPKYPQAWTGYQAASNHRSFISMPHVALNYGPVDTVKGLIHYCNNHTNI